MRRLALRLLGLMLLAGVALVGALAWRLSRAPIPLDMLTPHIEAALSRPGGPVTVRIGGTALAWDASQGDVVLRLRDVVVAASGDGTHVGSVPALFVRLSARALLGREIAPRRVTLVGPSVRLVRQLDGTVDLGLGESTAPVGDDLTLHELAGGLFARPGIPADEQLEGVGVQQGAVQLVDLASGRTWTMPRVDIDIRPDGDGVAGTLHGTLAMTDGDVPVAVTMQYQRVPEQVTITADLRGIVPAHIEGAPAAAARLAFPLAGRVTVTYDAGLRLTQARATVTGGQGTIDAGVGPLPVTRLAATVAIDVPAGTASIDDLDATIDGVVLGGRGRLTGLADQGTVEIEARLSHVAVAALPRWWPSTAAPDARAWVTTNVTTGQVREIEVRSTGTMQNADPATFATTTLTGTGSFDGLTVRYLDTMPPATSVGGTMTLAPTGLGFRIARGSVAGVEVVRATVDVPLGPKAAPRIPISTSIRGPLGATLAVLDKPPIGLARTIGVAPTDVGGTINGTLTLAVPLAGRVTAASLGVKVTADVRGGAVPRLVRGLDLTAADLSITRDGTTLAIRGPVRLAGVPATITWQEDQTGTATTRRRIDVQARVDDAGWKALGVDTYGLVQGPVALQAGYVEPRTGQPTVRLDGDLVAAAVDLQLLDLRKPAGRPGRAQATVLLRNGIPVSIPNASLQAGGSRVDGKATRSDDGTRWLSANVTAAVEPSGPGETAHRFTLALRPAGARNGFTFTCDDAGAFFRGIGSFADAEGGQLTATGTIDLSAPSPPPFDMQVDILKFRLTKEPIVTKVAQLTSLSGIGSAMRGGGLFFERMACGLSQRGHVVTITDGVAAGPSLGLTIRGTIDRGAGTLAMTGTMVPAYYGLNTVAGKIPLLGRLLTGGDKAGIQVFDFTAKGPLGDPSVSANVSSLVPGILRDLVRTLTR
ncbi:MAG TPA: DUF3971 domain-containing protein [Candidatus Binatia bacterium]|jgi:hypothetical protein|nr:DUF3971 domain-containing protein [Candidatus Binatia bacterium]